ncbi:MAG: sodium-extruding oxaloacetate decarboxylase subunit alpha [Pseudomonadota bacterium]
MAALKLTELVLRDAHQSLFATRLRIADMLPVCEAIDQAGYWSVESWGGATFDACIRYLGEDPWERLRTLKAAMPNTRQQMLLRGQNLLGYRHYADDVVERFVARAVANGMDVFRIFDALNDVRNLETAIRAAIENGAHAQGAMSYTVSPVHTLDTWIDMGKRLEDLGCHSICIKDMGGLITPYMAFDLVSRLKETVEVPIALHTHATTGLSTSAIVKAVEAGLDMADSAISSMSMTYGNSPTESVVAIFEGTERDTGFSQDVLAPIAEHFRSVRKKYAKFEGELRGVDARILAAQVPGGMLTNMENQLREQGMSDRMDEVLEEVPRVREDLGFVPLVTPTSQIVGTQAVLNVMTGERYKTITKETLGVLLGEYGATPAPVDADLQARVLEGADHEVIEQRPADLLPKEMDRLTGELQGIAQVKGIALGENIDEEALIHLLFPQVGIKFLENRGNPDAFEPEPTGLEVDLPSETPTQTDGNYVPEMYRVNVNGNTYEVSVSGGDVHYIAPVNQAPAASPTAAPAARQTVSSSPPPAGNAGEVMPSPLAGNVFKVMVSEGQQVAVDDVLVVLEAMKMETEIRSLKAGTVSNVAVREGDAVAQGQALVSIRE